MDFSGVIKQVGEGKYREEVSLDEEGGALDYQKVVHPRAKLYWLYKMRNSNGKSFRSCCFKLSDL
jgi:hypothetical protein